MSPTLTHLALHVPDLDACIAFYETFCGMRVIHRRPGKGSQIVWMAEPGQEQRFIFVIMPGGQPRNLASDDYSHFGFALSSRAAVDDLARRAEAAGCLVWAPRDEPYPVGYYCGLRDPAGNYVEFSTARRICRRPKRCPCFSSSSRRRNSGSFSSLRSHLR
ncbi:VOC family protein [Pseudomonas aeruginosa]|nr:VOC family protein [Pseudomonas aeruginosa]MCX2437057.1 VOC family protein [Pseudomonas aeruginosa]